MMATLRRSIGWPASSTVTARRKASHKRREWMQAYLYLLPAFAFIAIWVYWPAISTFRLSFFQWNLLATTPKIPVGWENYQNVLPLPAMGTALKNTTPYMLDLIASS